MASSVSECMTPDPISISVELSLNDAMERMHAHQIRHLPVYEGGHLVGVVSQRDIAVVSGIPSIESDSFSVAEAMSPHPYTCAPDADLGEVVNVLLQKKIGAAVVMDEGKLAGMFTVVDALAELSRRLGAEN